MSNFAITAARRDAVLEIVSADGITVTDVSKALGFSLTSAGAVVQAMVHDGSLIYARGSKDGRQEYKYFANQADANVYLERVRVELEKNRRIAQRARDAARREERNERLRRQRAETRELRLQEAAERRAARVEARREEREAKAAERRRKRAAEARAKRAASKRIPGARQLLIADAHLDRRRKEALEAKYRRSNLAKVDPIIPEGLKVTVLPGFKGDRFGPPNRENFVGEFGKAGIGRYLDQEVL